MVPLDFCSTRISSRIHQQQHDDSSCSSSVSRRAIFPIAVHEKYNSPPTPLASARQRRRCLSSHIALPSRSLTSPSSIESDMPSLTSDSTISTSTTSSTISTAYSDDKSCYITNDNDSAIGRKTIVRFNPRIMVHEFERSKADRMALWFSTQDLNTFKLSALRCIMIYNARQDCDKDIWNPIMRKRGRVLFSHPALGVDNEYDNEVPVDASPIRPCTSIPNENQINQFRDAVAENEIRNILVVDPQDIFLKLYTKGLRRIFPHATIVTAGNHHEALLQVKKLKSNNKSLVGFDIVINDEPIDQKNSLFQAISKENDTDSACGRSIKTLCISVCSKRNLDTSKFITNGTDVTWSKPPPLMNNQLRDTLLQTLLVKRGRKTIAKKLFLVQ